MKRIAILITYFGEFPEWTHLFMETLKRNANIDFIFYTDQKDAADYESENIRFHVIEFENYLDKFRKLSGLQLKASSPYKICDYRPLFGKVHREDFQDYEFYGWTDMDILFGNISSFYTDDVLDSYDVISAHEVRISGHLALFKNTETNRNMYRKIYDLERHLMNPEFVGIDEHGLTNAYLMTNWDRFNEKFGLRLNHAMSRNASKKKRERILLKERYSTPFTVIPWLDGSQNSDHPSIWYYKDGIITNHRDQKNFMYLHFMNFRNSQWRHDGSKAPWEGKKSICSAEVSDMKKGIVIDSEGIHPL